MRFPFILIAILILFASSCRKEEENICQSQGDFCLNDVQDKQVITGDVIIDCSCYNKHIVDRILINGIEQNKDDILALTESGYYRLEVFWTSSGVSDSDVIRFVILDPERGEAEWGLKKWTPRISPDIPDDREIKVIYPSTIPDGVNFPLVVMAGDEINQSPLHQTASLGLHDFRIKKGIGSVQIPPDDQADLVLTTGQHSIPVEIEFFEKDPIILHGVLPDDLLVPAGSYLLIDEDLTLPEDLTLTINAGTVIVIHPMVNVNINGTLLIRGSQEDPVTVTCSDPTDYWGGFIGNAPGNRIEASYAIFCQSGYHSEGIYNYGHAKRQALFYSEAGTLSVSHCYMIDHIGQVFYPVSSTVDLQNSLVQRAKTGGQINSSVISIDNCIFTDFPDDSYVYRDEDNDGLYLTASDAIIRNSVFMYAKDDGLDSGADAGGDIQIIDTRFETVFHEGAALSSMGSVEKLHTFTGCTFTNCGQGLELGFSSPNHQVNVDSCLFTENGIGIRYGDNYNWAIVQGSMLISNSNSIDNDNMDIWNMVRKNNWSADTLKMQFDNVWVSREVPMYPQLKILE